MTFLQPQRFTLVERGRNLLDSFLSRRFTPRDHVGSGCHSYYNRQPGPFVGDRFVHCPGAEVRFEEGAGEEHS